MATNNKENVILTINKHINEFYKLKDQYETDYKKKIVKPILDKGTSLSWKEKRKLLLNAPKPRCVNCKRNVGTIFSVYLEESNESNNYYPNRIFSATCGDKSDPCPLNIYLQVQPIPSLNYLITYHREEIDKIKKNIIIEKNNMLFSYNNPEEVTNTFDNLVSDLEYNGELYEIYLKMYIANVDDPERQQELRKLIITFGENVQQFKMLVNEFNKTGQQDIIESITNYYIDELEPLATRIRETKYKVNYVEHKDDGMYYLVQRSTSISDEEYNDNSTQNIQNIVKNFVVGVQKSKTKTATATATVATARKTIKNVEKEPKNITKKATLIIEDEEESPPIVITSTSVKQNVSPDYAPEPTYQQVSPDYAPEPEEENVQLFSDPEMEKFFDTLPYDEQMRLFDMFEPERSNELKRMMNEVS
jgi:hypothetical protein